MREGVGYWWLNVVVVVGVSFHVLVCGCVFRDLDSLHDQEHGDPNELQASPDGEGDGEGVAEDDGAEGGAEDVAGRGCWFGEEFEVCQDEAHVEDDAKFHAQDVQEEVADVVVPDAVIDPGTVVVFFCDTATAAAAVF